MQVVSDPTSNRPEQLEDAVETIGRSANRLVLFKEIYKGKSQVKSVSFLEQQTGLSKKQVLTAGKALADGNVVNQTKTADGETGYEKIRSTSHIRAKIIRGVEKPETIKAVATKRRPAVSTEPTIFKTRKPSKKRSNRSVVKLNKSANRIAILTASPIGENPIDVSLEAREIETERMKAASRQKFDIKLYPAATADSLLTAINDFRPVILHFSGHGNLSGLSLDNKSIEDTGGTYLEFKILSKLIASAPIRPKLLFLNACQSVGGASDLTSVSDVVIAMKDSVNDSTAFHYSRRFYSSLFSELSIQQAHNQAKAILEIDDPSGAKLPDIFTADGVDPSEILFR